MSPHLHLIVADGAWLPDGTFYPYLTWDPEHLTRCLRQSVLASFSRLGLVSPEAVGAMMSWPATRSGFQVHVGELLEPEHRERLRQLLRYQTRPPVDLVRLQYLETTGVVRYRTRKGHDLEWTHPSGFLADFCQHVPEPRSARVSYHGFLANCKGNLSRPPEPEAGSASMPAGDGGAPSGRRRHRIPWARLVWRVWNADVERCPFCRKEMTRTAVLVERLELLRLLAGLHIHGPPSRPPPVPLPETPAETVQGRERWGRRRPPAVPEGKARSAAPTAPADQDSQDRPGCDAEEPQLPLEWPDEFCQVPPGWEDAE